MVTTLRRVFWLALLGGAGYAGWQVWRADAVTRLATGAGVAAARPAGRSGPGADPATPIGAAVPTARSPTWPPTAAPIAPTDRSTASTTGRPGSTPVDGACPDGYPIKANDNSGIFHVPGGRFYERTVPERCYADAADAEADGYRRAKA